MIREGAVAADLRAETAKNTVDAMMEQIGMGIGVACTGLSGAGDIVVVIAGPYVSPSADGCVPDAKWGDRFRVNVYGSLPGGRRGHGRHKRYPGPSLSLRATTPSC